MHLVRRKELISILGISESTLNRMIKDGRFPPPLRIGQRAVAWRRIDVDAWIAERQSDRKRERRAS